MVMSYNPKKVDWFKIYLNRQNEVYRNYFIKKYAMFLDIIWLKIHDSKSLAEFGCGAGHASRALYTEYGYKNDYHLFDISKKMLQLTEFNLNDQKEMTYFLHKRDIRETIRVFGKNPFFDIIYSHGVLEHFTNEDIKKILENQKKHTNKIIHYVPSSRYLRPSCGNERLMTPKHWKDVSGWTECVEDNEGKDLTLIWE